MHAFTRHTGVAAPLLRINIDTDQIIPSREMKTVGKQGLAQGLFAGWRYLQDSAAQRAPDPAFVLNQPAYAGASILLAGANFGCGSSREHAVWALAEAGFRCVIAPGFGAIFHNNCIRNGLLPVVLAEREIATLADEIAADPQRLPITVDLVDCTVSSPAGRRFAFTVDPAHRGMLLEGLDAIGLTLKRAAQIDAHVAQDRQRRPWAYLDVTTGNSGS